MKARHLCQDVQMIFIGKYVKGKRNAKIEVFLQLLGKTAVLNCNVTSLGEILVDGNVSCSVFVC